MSPPTPSNSLRLLAAALLALALGACQAPGPAPHLKPARFAALPGWAQDDHPSVLAQFKAQCAKAMPDDPIHRQLRIDAPAYRALCARANETAQQPEAARKFFEDAFQPYAVQPASGETRLFTGYFEPELAGALAPSRRFAAPIYRPPADLLANAPYAGRAEIDAGKLRGRNLEIAWLEDRVAALELQIQGSGRVRLPDGKILRVGFAAHNGRSYTAIGRVLVAEGALSLEQANWPAIKAWLRANPARADDIINRNERYIFFRALPATGGENDGPLGSLGIPLTPGRSVAVDRTLIPLGLPLFVDTALADGAPWRRLMLAQDTGGAIKGAVRGDIFFGAGPRAETLAGAQRQTGSWWLLLPKK